MRSEIIERPHPGGFVRRHKVLVGAAAIGALFAALPNHRRLLTVILLCIALAVAAVIAAIFLAGLTTQPEQWKPTVAPSPSAPEPASSSVWCTVAPKTFC